MAPTTKPTLLLVGPKDGMVSLDDLIVLFEQLTGKDPTPEDVEEAEAIFATCDARAK
jgi:hypothetical protein